MRISKEAARHRQTGDGDDLSPTNLPPDWEQRNKLPPSRKDSPKRIEDCGNAILLIQAFLERKRIKTFPALLFAVSLLVALLLLTSSQSKVVFQNFRSQDQKQLRNRPYPSCSEDGVLRWLQASKHIRALKRDKDLQIGLVNFKHPESIKWELLSGGERPHLFKFKTIKQDLEWSAFFPEEIDEEDPRNCSCPSISMPLVPKNLTLDLIVASIPCDRSRSNRGRDVQCLQAFWAAARVAAGTGTDFIHVAFCGECRPYPNLFTCKELVEHHDGVWLYKLDLRRLRNQLTLPIGSCQLAVPPQAKVDHDVSREAYATILHSAESYVCGAISLAHSIRRTGSTRDMVLLVDNSIKPDQRQGLELAGWKVYTIDRIRNPKAEPASYNEWNYSKFRLWQLTQYDKLIYIDADIVLMRNLDLLFDLPEITATRNDQSLFNSGVMVIEPSNCTFEYLLENINEIESYNGGDQGYLNEIFTWWHRLPETMNFLKHFDNNTVENRRKLRLFTAEPPAVYAMHFLGIKPWLCFRDYDCNWNQNQLHIFANDAVHSEWWKLHDTMSPELQKFCLLQGTQKFLLEWDIIKARRKKYPDGHWKRRIEDPRWHAVESRAPVYLSTNGKIFVRLALEMGSEPEQRGEAKAPAVITMEQFRDWKRRKDEAAAAAAAEKSRKRAEDIAAGRVRMNGRELYEREPWVFSDTEHDD